ncbi:NACHT domain-containing NTPase [Escherichia coli]
MDTSENVSGYSLINFNSSNIISDGRIFYRKYNKEKTCYEPWEERGNGGVFDFTTEKTLTFDSEKFATLSNEILEKTDKDLLINIGISDEKKKSLRTLFTEPNFLEFALGAMPSMEIKSTQELLEGRNNLVIVGNHSSGKTSLLKYLFIKSLEKQASKDFSNFAFFLDLNAIELNSLNTIVSALCTQYFNADSTTSFEEKIKKMLHEGRCVIYIDNLDNINTKEQCVISDFFIKFKECRFIVTAGYNNSDLVVKILSDESKAKFHAIAIGSLRRSNVRDIVSRWHDTTSQNIIYKEITRTINNSQLPHNYFTYSMLLAIYEVDHDVKGILSESDIIENFIEILLRKHFMDTPPNKPQFKELRHFLGYLGFTLFKNKCNFISNNELLQTAIIFNRDTMHDYQVEDYIKPLKECGILKEELCNVIFSQPCFLYYSIAYFMKHNEELKKEILSDNNYLHLHKVIEYYSSQNSSSLDLLYLLKKKTNAIKSSLSERMLEDKGINIEDIKIEDSNTFSILDMVSTQDDFEKKIESLRADREKDDARLDELSPLSDKDKKANISNVRAEGNNNLLHDLINTLSLYARVFRSTELSMERENILNIFNDLVKGYVFYMKASLVLMDDSFVLPVILPALEKKMQEDKLTDNERQRVFEMFKLVLSLVRSMIPNNIQFIMSNDLSSKKPRIANIITESKDSNSNPVEKAILTFTLMDIKDEMVIQLANDLAKIQNKVVQESLFFKINQIITSNYDLKRTEEEALKELAKNIGIKRKLILTPKISDAFNTLNRIGH